MLPAEGRRLMQDYWGAKVVDIYTTRECGYLAVQCPQTANYHVQEGAFVEILRPDDTPCQPGETGRVVVTPLHNLAMPMIRYDLDDLAEAGPSCACGRGLPVLTRIAGRVRNMLRLPDGNRVWPLIGTYRDAIPAIRQRQVVQHSLQELELRLVVERPLTASEENSAKAELLARIGHPFEVRISYVDGFPRSGGGKFEEFRCDISGG
jgi:phenylacetate-CoA ligase